MTTKGERDRAYHVLMAALSEENVLRKLPSDELAKRQDEIRESCYGDQKPKKGKE